jgi:hypothetical protein
MTWKPANFLVARAYGPQEVPGYAYRGLGLHLSRRASPKGRNPTEWTLIHLGSGHRICYIRGGVATSFPVATEIAECGDWTFSGLTGYLNVDPEIKTRVVPILMKHKCVDAEQKGSSDEGVARQIAMASA